jgi:hypothetical protein
MFGGINPLNAKLNPICHLLALLGAHPILHVSRIGVKVHSDWRKLCNKELMQLFGDDIYFHLSE